MKNTKRGFTLIELLVVIAIIAILAAILFPVFAKVREKARQTSCLSNEKQISLAFQQYFEDYDEIWPAGATTKTTPLIHGFGWAGSLYPYIKSTGVLKCPDDPTSNGVVGGGDNTVTYPVSYAFNSNAANEADAAFVAPTSTVILFEVQGVTANVTASFAAGGDGDGFGTNNQTVPTVTDTSFADNGTDIFELGGSSTTLVYATGTLGGSAFPGGLTGANLGPFTAANGGLHTGGSNYLLADGHAKWFRGAAVSLGWTNTSSIPGEGTQGSLWYAAQTSYSGTPSFAATFSLN